ncbi:LysR family transcriptional regulator [uncultured Deefgea sp.]|uniref:LysR family transcriptional regulator n=1 Tax=uncultured Deefgea sp. TaxID=1304914 RepID=UPI00262DCC43|nr:LysR family transcriptional regulator [uncultured Deefgea sp.]
MLRLSLEALEILDAIARRGSFAAAAAEVHRVPSAVTYMVRKLEDDLGVEIFDRSGHRAQLTPAGLELLNEGRHLLLAAGELECRIKRVATGWETELVIAVDTVLPFELIWPMIAQFDALQSGTRLRFIEESLGGSWESLQERRADLVIGAISHLGNHSATQSSHVLGELSSVFVVAPSHPLASVSEPLAASMIQQYRAIVVPDSSHHLLPYTIGLLSGQQTLRVPSMQHKVNAQIAGLGCGYLPLALAAAPLADGRLVAKAVAEVSPPIRMCFAWQNNNVGHALKWWLDFLMHDVSIKQWLARGVN